LEGLKIEQFLSTSTTHRVSPQFRPAKPSGFPLRVFGLIMSYDHQIPALDLRALCVLAAERAKEARKEPAFNASPNAGDAAQTTEAQHALCSKPHTRACQLPCGASLARSAAARTDAP